MDPFELIFFLIVLALLALGFVLPIVALVLAITTRKRLNKEIARLRSSLPPDLAQQISPAGPHTTTAASALQQLEVRIEQIEATLRLMRDAPKPPVVPVEQPQPLPAAPIPKPQIDAPPPPPPPRPIEPIITPTPRQAADIESISGSWLMQESSLNHSK